MDPDDLTKYKGVDWKKTVNDLMQVFNGTRTRRFAEASRNNVFNLGEAEKMYRGIQPWYDQLQDQIGKNALSFSRGELPADVVSNIGRAASSRGLASGIGMGAEGARAGGALGNLNLRNLGLTSLDLSKYGTGLAMDANAQAKNLSPGLFDPSSLMITPGQALEADVFNSKTGNQWAGVLNGVLGTNISTRNSVNQMGAESQLASDMQQAQMIAAVSSMAGGQVASGFGGKIGAGSSIGGTDRYGTSFGRNSAGIPNAGSIPGYRWTGDGYTKLA